MFTDMTLRIQSTKNEAVIFFLISHGLMATLMYCKDITLGLNSTPKAS